MAEFQGFSLQQRVSQQQKQVQTQKMSQQQIMSLNLLSMNSLDLRNAIYEMVEKNPALEIVRDDFAEGSGKVLEHKNYSDNLKISSSRIDQHSSDLFQQALESSEDKRLSLKEHLLHQYLSTVHTPSEEKLAQALIQNLDSRGFHMLSPVSLLDKNDPEQNLQLLERCLSQIQQLDPAGCCCNNLEESLFVQAKYSENPDATALAILDGYFDCLNVVQPQKIQKKILQSGGPSFSAEQIQKALEFIKTLEPFPARNFGEDENRYIQPDVYVIKNEDGSFSVRMAKESLPRLAISRDFQQLSMDRNRVTKSTEESEKHRSEHRFVMDCVRDAKVFQESILFRESTVLKACARIVEIQKDFFSKGPGNLLPLKQKDLAAELNVHEATVSRMAKGKYLQCEWGLFEISYFFTNAAVKTAEAQTEVSQESVLVEIEKLLKENQKKPLSDQKIADLLEQKGIKIARRTVAKYRAKLNISSSYGR